MNASPVVYFIDDSATMREVIKIAFRRENINVITCHDPGSALTLMDQTAPDVVISDVIMPEKDGYEVCQHIKQHPALCKTPVILMSGVVNRSVAEKAFAVKADELIRKPFQPQDLITRVRHLLHGKNASRPTPPPAASVATMNALSSIFQTPATGRPLSRSSLAVVPRQAPTAVAIGESGAAAAPALAPPVIPAMDEPLAEVCAQMDVPGEAASVPVAPATGLLPTDAQDSPQAPAKAEAAPASDLPVAAAQSTAVPAAAERKPRVPEPPALQPARTRIEILRLQSQIKKLEAELAAEREYARALEEHIKTLQEAE